MSALAGFANISKVPELRRRVIFTMAMLAVFRIGAFVTIPGIDRNVMRAVMNKQGGGLLGFFSMFSGGALSNMSIFALGIMPYVSASIVLQLLTMVFKPLDELRKEGQKCQEHIRPARKPQIKVMQKTGISISTPATGRLVFRCFRASALRCRSKD